MGVKTRRSGPAKPPEGRIEAETPSDTSRNWRTKATRGNSEDGETEIDRIERDFPEETKRRRLRIAEVYKDQEDAAAPKEPSIPYRRVPEVVITVPRKEPLKALSQPQPEKAEEKLYQVRAPVQKEGLVRRVVKKLLEGEITLRGEEILGVSPPVREEFKKEITKVRIPLKKKETALMYEDPSLPFEFEDDLTLRYDALRAEDLPPVEHVFVVSTPQDGFAIGSVIVPDVYTQYLETLASDEAPKQVLVARDSASLRVIYPIVHKSGTIESVLDSGSQIVSMSYAKAKELGLNWNPDIQIYMQSANGSLEKSVGLARNVSFKFGDITVYLQVHIINGPAYDILLGRPFEVLTESGVQNNQDGSQILTLRDPNTGKRCSMPTQARGNKKEPPKHRRATVETVEDEENVRPNKTADSTGQTEGFRPSSRN
jgi:hypothetical protein